MKPLDVVVARDGSLGVAVIEVDPVIGRLRITERGLGGEVLLNPRDTESLRVRILIDAVWLGTDEAANRTGPRLRVSDGLPEFFSFVLGEWLDRSGMAVFGPETILGAAEAVYDAHERTGADLRVIEAYVAGKIRWGYEFGFSPVGFTSADARRLQVTLEKIHEVAFACAGDAWSIVDSQPPRYRPKRVLDRSGSRATELLNVARIPWRDGDELPRNGMDKALQLRAGGDHENAVKEAVAALETIALDAADLSTGTLGDAIKTLRTSGVVPRPIDKTLEGLWGYSSNAAGIRHRSGDGQLDESTATYLIDSAAAAITFLIGRSTP